MSQNAVHAWEQACQLFAAGRTEEAAAICSGLRADSAKAPLADAMLSSICLRNGRMRLATFHALSAYAGMVSLRAEDKLMISGVLAAVGESATARRIVAGILAKADLGQSALCLAARRAFGLEMISEARSALEGLQGNGGDLDAESLYILGFSRMLLGETELACEAYESAIAKRPGFGQAFWGLAQAATSMDSPERIRRIELLLDKGGLDHGDECYAHYALFRELDAIGEVDTAWFALSRGAALRRSLSAYDDARDRAIFDSIISATSGWRLLPNPGHHDVVPVFVVGMPRTGTTVLERILGQHESIHAAGELADWRMQLQWVCDRRLPVDFGPEIGDVLRSLDHELLGQRYIRKVAAMAGTRYVVDKYPANFLMCGPILKAIPQARILHMRRSPVDSCFSNFKELFARGHLEYSYRLDELAAYYMRYERLMRHWHEIAPGRILDVCYEDLVVDPVSEAKRVLQFIGLPYQPSITDIEANPSLTTSASALQVREGIHSRNLDAWRRYQAHLAPLLQALQETASRYPDYP